MTGKRARDVVSTGRGTSSNDVSRDSLKPRARRESESSVSPAATPVVVEITPIDSGTISQAPIQGDASNNVSSCVAATGTASFGKPPYPAEYLLQKGGVEWIPLPGEPLHPCVGPLGRAHRCIGGNCPYMDCPALCCWSFTDTGTCGFNLCRAKHVVRAEDGSLFIFANKKVKLNQTVSRVEAKQNTQLKHQRLTITAQRVQKNNQFKATLQESANKVMRSEAEGALLGQVTRMGNSDCRIAPETLADLLNKIV